MAETVPIPEPAGLPVLGNIGSFNPEYPLGSMMSMAEEHGEIYRLRFPGRTVVIVSSHRLVNELCDEKRFKKSVNSALEQVRHGVHDGLFTARLGEPNWAIAHRVLMPAFGPMSIRGMYDEMHDIAAQLALKWARYGPDSPIMVTDDFTRLTLDTLALCSMGYRFNSYYSPTLHPFISAMGDFLIEAGNRPRRLPLPGLMYRNQDQKFFSDIDVLRKTAQGVLDARRAGHSDRKDLLTVMLDGVDSLTGQRMTDESVMDNLITFLIAGHETTSGMLSFAFYQLLNHPEIYAKAQREVDEAVGKGPIKVEHLAKLPYMSAILRETLRLNATIPLFTVEAFEDEVIGGKYLVHKGETVINLLAKSQVDPAVFGDTALDFIPERMLDEEFNRLNKEFPNCWKPFGNGVRGCIGRPFAWQEALLVMAMLLQNFDFRLDPEYKLRIGQTLTIKPKDMHMFATLRDGLDPTQLEHRLAGTSNSASSVNAAVSGSAATGSGNGVPLSIFYGSNSGTCESLAQHLAADAPAHGFAAKTVDRLDNAKGQLPKGQPIIIITASYEGQPPDNAREFVEWVEGLDNDKKPLADVSYAVFGCGNREWTQTFHRIPRLVDNKMHELGGARVADMGVADAANGDVFTEFETWEDDVLWPALSEKWGTSKKDNAPSSNVSVLVSRPRPLTLRQEVKEAKVVENRTLTSEDGGERVKKHVEIRLPEDMSYTAGDYLAVLPINPKQNVTRAMRRFDLPWDAYLTISADGPTSLPTQNSVPAYDILASHVELAQPATKRNILLLADSTQDEAASDELKRLANESYNDDINAKRVSVLDLLERFPSAKISIGSFLAMLPPMRTRQYSISSSPKSNPHHATLTFSVLNEPSFSGQGSFYGVASSYLASLDKGDTLQVAVRPSHAAFGLPKEPETPIICIGAGTGIAPFRGFIQERALMISEGRTLAPAILFFGCRTSRDDLYADELAEWERMGAVSVRRSYSRESDQSDGCKHVDDRLWRERQEVAALWEQGAHAFVCGPKSMADSVRATFVRIHVEAREGEEADVGKTEEWFDSLRNVRYMVDVFD